MKKTAEKDIYHSPRLYFEGELRQGMSIPLPEQPSHYLKNVMRREIGDKIRLFNQASGEFLCTISDILKKNCIVTCDEQIREPRINPNTRHLYFSPLKKDKMDFLTEKAVELGVTHLHPVLFERSVIRDIKEDRIKSQIIEASEQCERLDIPNLLPLQKLDQLLKKHPDACPLYAAIERQESIKLLHEIHIFPSHCALLIGPEGGLTNEEIAMLQKHSFITPVTFGDRILRAETAALYGLSLMMR